MADCPFDDLTSPESPPPSPPPENQQTAAAAPLTAEANDDAGRTPSQPPPQVDDEDLLSPPPRDDGWGDGFDDDLDLDEEEDPFGDLDSPSMSAPVSTTKAAAAEAAVAQQHAPSSPPAPAAPEPVAAPVPTVAAPAPAADPFAASGAADDEEFVLDDEVVAGQEQAAADQATHNDAPLPEPSKERRDSVKTEESSFSLADSNATAESFNIMAVESQSLEHSQKVKSPSKGAAATQLSPMVSTAPTHPPVFPPQEADGVPPSTSFLPPPVAEEGTPAQSTESPLQRQATNEPAAPSFSSPSPTAPPAPALAPAPAAPPAQAPPSPNTSLNGSLSKHNSVGRMRKQTTEIKTAAVNPFDTFSGPSTAADDPFGGPAGGGEDPFGTMGGDAATEEPQFGAPAPPAADLFNAPAPTAAAPAVPPAAQEDPFASMGGNQQESDFLQPQQQPPAFHQQPPAPPAVEPSPFDNIGTQQQQQNQGDAAFWAAPQQPAHQPLPPQQPPVAPPVHAPAQQQQPTPAPAPAPAPQQPVPTAVDPFAAPPSQQDPFGGPSTAAEDPFGSLGGAEASPFDAMGATPPDQKEADPFGSLQQQQPPTAAQQTVVAEHRPREAGTISPPPASQPAPPVAGAFIPGGIPANNNTIPQQQQLPPMPPPMAPTGGYQQHAPAPLQNVPPHQLQPTEMGGGAPPKNYYQSSTGHQYQPSPNKSAANTPTRSAGTPTNRAGLMSQLAGAPPLGPSGVQQQQQPPALGQNLTHTQTPTGLRSRGNTPPLPPGPAAAPLPPFLQRRMSSPSPQGAATASPGGTTMMPTGTEQSVPRAPSQTGPPQQQQPPAQHAPQGAPQFFSPQMALDTIQAAAPPSLNAGQQSQAFVPQQAPEQPRSVSQEQPAPAPVPPQTHQQQPAPTQPAAVAPGAFVPGAPPMQPQQQPVPQQSQQQEPLQPTAAATAFVPGGAPPQQQGSSVQQQEQPAGTQAPPLTFYPQNAQQPMQGTPFQPGAPQQQQPQQQPQVQQFSQHPPNYPQQQQYPPSPNAAPMTPQPSTYSQFGGSSAGSRSQSANPNQPQQQQFTPGMTPMHSDVSMHPSSESWQGSNYATPQHQGGFMSQQPGNASFGGANSFSQQQQQQAQTQRRQRRRVPGAVFGYGGKLFAPLPAKQAGGPGTGGGPRVAMSTIREALTQDDPEKGFVCTAAGQRYVKTLDSLPAQPLSTKNSADQVATLMGTLAENATAAGGSSLLEQLMKLLVTNPKFDWGEGGQRQIVELLANSVSQQQQAIPEPANMEGLYASTTAANPAEQAQAIKEIETLLMLPQQQHLAVEVALKNKLYSFAFMISQVCPTPAEHQKTVSTLVKDTLQNNSPLASIFYSYNGMATQAKDELRPSIDNWTQHVQMLVSNYQEGTDETILQWGDRLSEEGRYHDAHFCFMLITLTKYGAQLAEKLANRIKLLGGVQRRDRFRNAFFTPENVLLTEVQEFLRQRDQPKYVKPSLISFRTMLGLTYLEFGMTDKASAYLDAAAKCLPTPTGEKKKEDPFMRSVCVVVDTYRGIIEQNRSKPQKAASGGSWFGGGGWFGGRSSTPNTNAAAAPTSTTAAVRSGSAQPAGAAPAPAPAPAPATPAADTKRAASAQAPQPQTPAPAPAATPARGTSAPMDDGKKEGATDSKKGDDKKDETGGGWTSWFRSSAKKKKKDEPKDITSVVDAAEAVPEYDPVTGRYKFAMSEEEKAVEEQIKAGPPKMPGMSGSASPITSGAPSSAATPGPARGPGSAGPNSSASPNPYMPGGLPGGAAPGGAPMMGAPPGGFYGQGQGLPPTPGGHQHHSASAAPPGLPPRMPSQGRAGSAQPKYVDMFNS